MKVGTSGAYSHHLALSSSPGAAIWAPHATPGSTVIPRASGFEKSLSGMLSGAADGWVASTERPRPSSEHVRHWDALVGLWIEDPKLPLLIRKSGDRGLERRHPTGRQVVCVDNSPAHWTLACAIRRQTPAVEELLAALQSGEWPVVFAMSKAEVAKLPRYRGVLARSEAAKAINDGQWKVCHIDDVGLRTKGAVTEVGITTLKEHCRRLLAPSNMFLVPNSHGGFGELPEVVEAFRRARL